MVQKGFGWRHDQIARRILNTFPENLARLRVNLERLEALYAKDPDFFKCAGEWITVEPGGVRVILHYNRDEDCDWRAVIRRVGGSGWRRENGVVAGRWDYRGTVDGVEVIIIGAEARPEPEALEVL